MTPVHPHDCVSCIFMGTLLRNDTQYDLYACPALTPAQTSTVIARYGRDGDYASSLEIARQLTLVGCATRERTTMFALRVAYLMAVDLGLLPEV